MVGVGEMIASAVVKEIVGRLTQSVIDEISLQWGYKGEVQQMVEKMKDLAALMHDADIRLRRGEENGEAAGRWLMKLKSVAYDIEDVLDDLEAPNSQPKCHILIQRITGPRKLDKVRKKIDELERENLTPRLLAHHEPQPVRRNNETFAASNRTGMVGRNIERDKIINLLLNTEADEDISVIPIVGLGGIGKTTLAEAVYTDERVKNFFHIQSWVYVSKEFDLQNIGFAIMKSLGSNINLYKCTSQRLHDNLKKGLASTKYLIVLDDLWEEDGDNLEKLKLLLQYGSKGSKIVVTTRNISVVRKLCVGNLANERKVCPVPESAQISLDILAPEHCWEVMKQRALGPRDHGRNDLEKVGIQIAQNCGGLPLVLGALGQVMSESKDVKRWEEIRDTKIDLRLEDAYQKKILECLMPSYYYMKADVKMCFMYLAAFPKGFIMNTDLLVKQWDALGYIPQGYDGQICIDYLLGMSFLQISGSALVIPNSMHAKVSREVTMHDLVHELASVITADEFLLFDADDTIPRNWKGSIHCRHTQLIEYKKQTHVFKDLPRKLRSLHFRNSLDLQLPKQAFSRYKYMRVLNLSPPRNIGGSMRLPSSMHKLKLLRYFDATGLPIASLPKSFPKLHNMQTLIISNCALKALPDNICSLHSLCYLDLSSNRGLNKLPMSFGKLSKLSFLNLLGCFILQDLPESICQLTCLQHLDMSECRAIQHLPDKFGSLSNLMFLSLSGCSDLTKLPESFSLKSLEFLNLSHCQNLENLPQDFGNLQELQFLSLSDCYKISSLPESFCQLIHLKDLNLSDCHDLKELPKCVGNLSELDTLNLTSCCKLQQLPESLCQLFKLRHLNVSYCVRLEVLPSSLGKLKLHILDINCALALEDLPDGLDEMSSLTQLEFMNLKHIPLSKAKAIEKHLQLHQKTTHLVHQTENKKCSSIVDLAQLTTCHELAVEKLHNVQDPEDGERAKLREKPDLRKLSLTWGIYDKEMSGLGLEDQYSYLEQRKACKQLGMDKHFLERFVPPRILEGFFLYGYMSKDFPKWMCNISFYLPSLITLSICDLEECDTLPSFGRLPNLRSLYLSLSPKIRKVGREFYGEGGACTKLRLIHVESMENLVEWWTTESGRENEKFLIPNLHSLNIQDCPKLKFLPYPPRSVIWQLKNSNEIFPEGGFGNLSSYTVPFQMAIRNCSLSPNMWHNLHYFATLENFTLLSCNSLRALPDVIGCFTILKSLSLLSLKELRVLPECLGQRLTLLESFLIVDCPKLTSLPESMENLTSLTSLLLMRCKELKKLPEGTGQLVSLQDLQISACPKLTSLPGSMKNLSTLRRMTLNTCPGIDVLPEWLGNLTSLQKLSITHCPDLGSLPESIRNLTALKELQIQGCPILVKRCQGEDAHKISHIPEIISRVNRVPWWLMSTVSEILELESTSGYDEASTSVEAGASSSGDAGPSLLETQ